MEIKGKHALVLGGSSGIGLAAAQQLAGGGARVTIMSRRQKALDAAAQQIGGEVATQQLDVRDLGAMQNIFGELAPFDILVNAATGGERAMGPFAKMDIEGFKGSFDKLWGYVHSVHTAIPLLAADGCIVLVSGYPARKCNPGASALSTVGNAVEGFTRAIAAEIAPIRINVVSPGVIDTPMFPVEGEARAKFLEQATAGALLKRAGTAEEVAHGILFAVKNDYVTGTTIDVDGGALLP